MIGFFIAVLSGALMSVQGVFNTQVTKTTGMWVSNAWVQFSALLLCLVAWLVAGRDSFGAIAKVEPKYVLLGGVIGAGITWTVIKSMAQLGPAKAAFFIVMSQLIVAYLIEVMGLFGVEKDASFHSSIGQIYQTWEGRDLYPSIEEKAAMLLYLVVKNHSFVDGNKRIAATLFLWFMQNNGILYRADGTKRISDASLVALTLMIAESHTDEMDTMVKVVVSLINRKN